MDEKDDVKPPVFPPEYADLEQPLRDAQRQSWIIDDQIENLPKDKGPQLAFRPPGYTDPNFTANREQLVTQLRERQSMVKESFNQTMERRLGSSEPQSANQIRKTVDYQLNNNSARPKHFDKSFEHMANMHSNKSEAGNGSISIVSAKTEEIPPSSSKNISERSMESLQHPDKSDAVEKYSDNAKEITEPDKE